MQYAELIAVCADGAVRMMIDGFGETEQLLPFVDVLAMRHEYTSSMATRGWW